MAKRTIVSISGALVCALIFASWSGCGGADGDAPDDANVGSGSGASSGSPSSTTGSGAGDNQPPPPTAVPIEEGLWCDPATWGGTVPGDDDDVLIPDGTTVTLDCDVRVHTLTVEGTLVTTNAVAFGDKAAWTKLATTAQSGASSVSVYDATGWAVGDSVVLTPTGTVAEQFEECSITTLTPAASTTSVGIGGCTSVSGQPGGALQFAHEVVATNESDEGDPTGKVHFAGEVLNMTRALGLTTTLFTVRNTGKVALENLVVRGVGIDWENTADGGSTRGLIVRGVVVDKADMGNTGLIIEGGSNLLWEDSIVYDVRGTVGSGHALVGFGWAPRTGKQNGTSPRRVDHVFAVRSVAARFAPSGGSSNAGYFISGVSGEDRAGIVGSVAVGLSGSGTYNTGYRTQESGCAGLQFFWRNEAHANANGLFIDGNMMDVFADGEPFVDGKLWRNRSNGLFWGAYTNNWQMHQYHFRGNLAANAKILNSSSNWSRFTVDGEGQSERGVWITAYVTPPRRWAPYARTIFRGNDIDIDLTRGNNVNANVFLEFPLSSPLSPTTNFCSEKRDEIFMQQSNQDFLIGPDQLRTAGATYTAPGCPGVSSTPSAMVVPPNVYAPGSLVPETRSIEFPTSHYRYTARRVKNGAQQDAQAGADHFQGFEDWTMVTEERVE